MRSTSEANWCDSGHLLRKDLIRCHLTFEIQIEENQKQNNGLSASCKRPQPTLHLSLRARLAEKNKVQLTKRRRLWGKFYFSMPPSLPWRQRDRLPSPTETWLSRRLGQFLWTRLLVAEPGSEVRRRSSHTVQAPVFESGCSHLYNPRHPSWSCGGWAAHYVNLQGSGGTLARSLERTMKCLWKHLKGLNVCPDHIIKQQTLCWLSVWDWRSWEYSARK